MYINASRVLYVKLKRPYQSQLNADGHLLQKHRSRFLEFTLAMTKS